MFPVVSREEHEQVSHTSDFAHVVVPPQEGKVGCVVQLHLKSSVKVIVDME